VGGASLSTLRKESCFVSGHRFSDAVTHHLPTAPLGAAEKLRFWVAQRFSAAIKALYPSAALAAEVTGSIFSAASLAAEFTNSPFSAACQLIPQFGALVVP
jgi:hypothetical protein